jgi:zinc protease
MLSLSFDSNALEVQRKVVIEEFKQRYLNQPYGDVWLKLRPLAYDVHPYKWATIGKEIAHIENATLDDVRSFFFTHYLPSNAIMVVAGNVKHDQIRHLSEKWFGPIPGGKKPARKLPKEPAQVQKKTLTVESKVPADAIYKQYHMPGRFHKDYYAIDLMSDILSRGHSSRLYNELVKEKEILTAVSAFNMGSIDPGLVIISGRLKKGVTMAQAEEEIDKVTRKLVEEGATADELEKVKNQAEATVEFGEVEVINRAMNLAFASLGGDPNLVNRELDQIRAVTLDVIARVSKQILREDNASVMNYKAAS